MDIHDKEVLEEKILDFFFNVIFPVCITQRRHLMFHKTTASVRTGSYVARFPNSKTSDITTCSSD